MLDLVLAAAGFVLLIAGGTCLMRALGHLRPDLQGRTRQTDLLFWNRDRFTATGRGLLRRGWALQAAGLGLWLLAAL